MTATMVPASLQAAIELMDNAAAELQRITERTEFALSVVTQAIRTQEAIAKGKVLKQLRDEIPDGEWMKFLNREDVQLDHSMALRFINASQLAEDAELCGFGLEGLEGFSPRTLAAIQSLPTEQRLEVLEDVDENGTKYTENAVREISRKTETKISKTAEQLAAAKARKQQKLDEGQPEWETRQETASIKKFEDRIKQLESELEREKEQKQELADSKGTAEDDLHKAQKRLEQAQTDLANALEESQKLRFDEDTARSQRVSRTGNQLVLTLPQTLADVQKFIADREYFAEKTRDAIENQINTLIAYLHEHYTTDQTAE